jgi:hypothetical protein
MESMTREIPCHLCVTHSPLVTRVFEATMRQQGIPEDAVRSIARRGVPFPETGLCLDDVSDELESCFRKFDRHGYAEAWKRFDETLDGLTGGKPFEAYIPHANKILYQEIMRHPRCAGYSFLEEGFTSMAWDRWPNVRSTWSKIVRNHLRTWWVGPRYRFNRPMFEHSLTHYRAAYAISKHAFHGMPGRTDVSTHVPPLPPGDGPGNTYVILDAGYLHLGIHWEDYEDALVASILKRALPGGEVLVKFHFADAKAPLRFESICRRLASGGGPEPRMLSPEFSVDDNLKREDLVLFALTSLGYYTAIAGGRVECFAGEIRGAALDSWIAGHRLPADFRQVVGLSDGE